MGPICDLCDPIQSTRQLIDPTQPNQLQVEKFGPNPTQPNTTNNGANRFVVTYFYTDDLSRIFSQRSRKIKFNCVVQPNLI